MFQSWMLNVLFKQIVTLNCYVLIYKLFLYIWLSYTKGISNLMHS